MSKPDPLWHYAPVIEARALGGHSVWLRFEDRLEGELDLTSRLEGKLFEPLRDPDYFAGFTIDHTLCWPNGADFAPEYLWDRVRYEKFGIAPPRSYVRGFLGKPQPVKARRKTAKKRQASATAKKRPSRRRA